MPKLRDRLRNNLAAVSDGERPQVEPAAFRARTTLRQRRCHQTLIDDAVAHEQERQKSLAAGTPGIIDKVIAARRSGQNGGPKTPAPKPK
ncbi:MAG: hypothetical protein C0434_08455 [Xanthomonadaceae bacterium]|nr:hypothetical protein [Xanthomonadaceae bacterium]